MIDKLKKILWKSEEHEELKTPKNVFANFFLVYQNLPVGTLSLNKGVWSFNYTEQFKRQSEIVSLIDFPDKHKSYTSEVLWPFFLSRIPGLGQPSIQQIILENNIEKDDEVGLLKLFGKRSISNPFLLETESAKKKRFYIFQQPITAIKIV